MNRSVTLAILLVVVAAPILAGGKLTLYNLKTGEVLHGQYKSGFFRGHGPIWAATPGGVKYSGEFTTVGFQDGAQRGTAVLTGNGLTIDCEYLARPGGLIGSHGTGTCQDSEGRRYKLIF